MVHPKERRLFAPSKIDWLLGGGLETLSGAERQMLFVMAETEIQDGYKPTSEEKRVVAKLCALAGDDYDVQDICKKVAAMVKGRKDSNARTLSLPSDMRRLIKQAVRTRSGQG
ncbi:MAG: hypothetical protein ISS56_15770 [Anaerolineae bacterium]|nr:hypothetical protein [Anaerolineae bacterium]